MSKRLNIRSEAGKGDDQRPRQVPREHYEAEYDRIFKQKEAQDQ